MKIIYLFIFYLTLTTNAKSQQLSSKVSDFKYLKFVSKHEVKAKGLDFSIEYPEGWINKDGDRPNIVQKFLCPIENNLVGCMVTIVKSDIEFDIDEIKGYNLTDYKSFIESRNLTSLEKGLKIDGIYTDMVFGYHKVERLNFKCNVAALTYYLFYKNYIITIEFSASSVPDCSESEALRIFKYYEPVFFRMANSFVLLSQWYR